MDDKIYNLAKKLMEMAKHEGGSENEKGNAMNVLQDIMNKYNIKESDLKTAVKSMRQFTCQEKYERSLLKQIAYKVTNEMKDFYHNKSKQKCFADKHFIELTDAEYIEVEFLFDFYKRIWESEKKAFFNAFVQKHNLFGELKEGEKGAEISLEELEKMHSLMRGLDNVTPTRQLTNILNEEVV